MPPINEKPVRLLMRDMAESMGLQAGDSFSREQAVHWFREHFPIVKEGTVTAHLIRLSTNAPSRLNYSARADGSDDLFFKVDSSHFRLYEPGHDPIPITKSTPLTEPIADVDIGVSSEFGYEHDLRDYLARNLQLLGPSLRLYEDEGITGVEFPVGGRYVDILAEDKAGYVVIELKVARRYDRVIGQLLRYVNWIKQHHADPGQSVRGIIVAKAISSDLLLACAELPAISLFEYSLSVSVRQVK